ncbi:MAG: hypothetical protein KAJ19_12150 [Gammaproteobacteria bacterium]|nr:hypothetical protein [Gammaproteobacteria bacterium]
MKITIEPQTDEEKANPQIKRAVLTGLAAVAMVGIPAEQPEQTALYYHFQNNLPLLQQRVAELEFQLTKIRLIAEAAQAQQQPRIQVAQPNIPFPAGNDRMRK